jgi:hypothetical protein
MGQPERERWNRTSRTRQTEQDRLYRAVTTGLSGQYRQDRTVTAGQPAQDSQDRTELYATIVIVWRYIDSETMNEKWFYI